MTSQPTSEIILEYNHGYNFKKWGFTIVRCTYTSQSKWETLLSRNLKKDAEEGLEKEGAAKALAESLGFVVIEDESLEGATWKQARARFDQWALKEMERTLISLLQDEAYQDDYGIDKASIMQSKILSNPAWSHFIYVDEASLNSVIDAAEAEDWKGEGR